MTPLGDRCRATIKGMAGGGAALDVRPVDLRCVKERGHAGHHELATPDGPYLFPNRDIAALDRERGLA